MRLTHLTYILLALAHVQDVRQVHAASSEEHSNILEGWLWIPGENVYCVDAAARQSFREQEALVYQQLAQLIRDGVWLKSYLAAVMRLEQEAFQVLLLTRHLCMLAVHRLVV